jgi:ATP-dependent DNA helicase RecG
MESTPLRQELQIAIGLKNNEHFRKTYLIPALDAGMQEMTQPDKPTGRSQRYRLTEVGLRVKETLAARKKNP